MFTWSLERAVVGFLSGAAVFVQGVIDAVSPPNFQPVGDSHPIPGCPDAVECRTHGCAGNCSESIEAEERQTQQFPCVVDDCFHIFDRVAAMNTHSYWEHCQRDPFKTSDDPRVTYLRYPGADSAGDFKWFGITRTAPAVSADARVSAAGGGSQPPGSPPAACTDPSPVGGEGLEPVSGIRKPPGSRRLASIADLRTAADLIGSALSGPSDPRDYDYAGLAERLHAAADYLARRDLQAQK